MAATTQRDLDGNAPGAAGRRRRRFTMSHVLRVWRAASADQLTVTFVAIAITLVALVVLGSHWTPVGDNALLELKVRDVPSHLPLIGVYSRFGWSHPGPLQFWLLAVPHQLFRSSSSLLFGALIGQLVAVVVAWWLARRISRVAGWTVLIALMAVLATVPGDMVRSPWNPFIALAAAGTVLVAAWATAERMPSGAICLVFFGSYLVQGHVVTLPLVAVVTAVAFALALWPRHGDRHRRGPLRDATNATDATDATDAPAIPWRAYEWAGCLAALLWAGPIIDQFISDSPNASMLQMGSSGGQRQGLSNALGVLTQSFAALPSWLRPETAAGRLVDDRWTAPLWLIVPIAGLVVAIIRRDARFVRGSVVAAAGLAGLVCTNAMITDGLFGYLVVEDRAVAAVAVAIGVASLARLVPSAWARPLTIGAAALVGALTVAVCLNVLTTPNPETHEGPEVRAMTAAIESRYGTDDRLVVEFARGDYSLRVSHGVFNALERDGYDVRLHDGAPILVGQHRVVEPGWGDVNVLVYSSGDPDVDELATDGWTTIGDHDGSEPLHVATRELSAP